MAEIAHDACERCRTRRPAPTCDGVAEDAWIDADPERLTMIVEHVIPNAQEATPQDGAVKRLGMTFLSLTGWTLEPMY